MKYLPLFQLLCGTLAAIAAPAVAVAAIVALAGSFYLQFLDSKIERPSKTNLELQKAVEELAIQVTDHNNRISSIAVSAGFIKPKQGNGR